MDKAYLRVGLMGNQQREGYGKMYIPSTIKRNGSVPVNTLPSIVGNTRYNIHPNDNKFLSSSSDKSGTGAVLSREGLENPATDFFRNRLGRKRDMVNMPVLGIQNPGVM